MPTAKNQDKRFVLVDRADLDQMIANGTARKFPGMPLYEQLAVAPAPVPKERPAQTPAEPETTPEPPSVEDDKRQDYGTRDMRPARRPRSNSKPGPKTAA